MSNSEYDIVIIGSGPGGYIAALKAAAMGARVAVVEKHLLGGTCLNYGCIPSKALLATAELNHRIAHAKDWGLKGATAEVDWKAVQKRKDRILRRLRGGVGQLFKARNVDLLEGHGRLGGAGKVTVEDADGNATELAAGKVILAVGSVPSRIPGWPDEKNLVCTSDEALHWDTLPAKLLIVGGGVIGCEFACMMNALGVEVTVVEMLPRLLPNMDSEIAEEMAGAFKKRGIAVHADTKVEKLSAADGALSVQLSDGQQLNPDRVLVATGRKPNTADVGLDTVGLEVDRGFVRVDDRMQTAAEGVYCIGDANGRCLLAHAASAQGIVAVRNALGESCTLDQPIPEAVYTFPEAAAVGLTPQRAREKGIPFSVGKFPDGHLGKAMAAGETEGFAKVLRHRETDEILGVHMVGHNVTECIAAAGAMMAGKMPAHAAAEVVIAHPTISEALHEGLEDAFGQALHMPPRKVVRLRAE
mgnify:FL=1